MAKVKRNSLFIEKYLIPVEEQPYKLPSNWTWIKFEAIAQDMADGSFGSNLKTEHYTENKEVRIIQLSNVSEYGWRDENTKYTTFEHVKTISRSIVEPGNIVIAKMMPAGRAMICPNNEEMYVLASDNIKVVPYEKLNTRFLLYGINSLVFRKQVLVNTQGITRARTSIKKIKSYAFPLAPLAEQQRIVEQIENLFTKLDEAKEKTQEALDGFITRRDAIFHMAFSGKMSKQWRLEKNIDDSRVTYIFSDVLDVRDGTHNSPQYYDDGYPLVTSKNLKNGIITDKDIKFISKEDYDQINQRSMVDVGDILFAMIGTIGNPVVVEEEPNFAIKNMALLKNIEKVNPYFIKYYLESRKVRDKMKKDAKGTTQKFVSLGYLREFPVLLPPDEEQAYIVDKLDELLSKEYQVFDTLENVLESIEMLRKSILVKAFRGELGTNNPDEESSIELLKQIIEQR